VDWKPYLLSAGESQLLGGAVVSRSLPHVNDGSDRASWTLGRMLQHRSQWLNGKRVLLVGAGGKMEAYVFIALALGAKEVGSASSREEARRMLLDHGEDTATGGEKNDGSRWDFVCEHEDERKELQTSDRRGPVAKKRKSMRGEAQGISESDLIEGLQGIKVVGTESVVQSLISGRLLDASELA
jgi:hypothetical protein